MKKKPTTRERRDIPAQLRAWRERHGLSQSAAAQRLGLTLDTLQNWEQSRNQPRGLARASLLKLIAK
jgi:putative transcriptional regulator